MTGYPASPPIMTIVIRGVVLAISCVISYWLITHILTNTYAVSMPGSEPRRHTFECLLAAGSGKTVKLLPQPPPTPQRLQRWSERRRKVRYRDA